MPQENEIRHQSLVQLEQMRPDLLRYCLAMTGSQWTAEEVVSEAFLKIIDLLHRQPAKVVNQAYVVRTAKNTWIDICRQQRRRPEQFLQGHFQDANGTDESKYITRELLECLAHRLQPKSFVVLLLCDVFDFTARETAFFIHSTEGAIQVLLSRARIRLRKLYLNGITQFTDLSAAGTVKPVDASFFEAVVKAFHNHEPRVLHEAYLSLYGNGASITSIRKVSGKFYFTFRDPDGNLLMVSS